MKHAAAVKLAARFVVDRQRIVDAEAHARMTLGAGDARLRAGFERAFSGRATLSSFAEIAAAFRAGDGIFIGDYRTAPWFKSHAAALAIRLRARVFATDALDHKTQQPILGLTDSARDAILAMKATLCSRGIDLVAVGSPQIRDPIARASTVLCRIPRRARVVAFVGEHVVAWTPLRARFPGTPLLVFDRLPSPLTLAFAASALDSDSPPPFRLTDTAASMPPRFLWPLHPPALKVQTFLDADGAPCDIDPCRLGDAWHDAACLVARAFGITLPSNINKVRLFAPSSVPLWRALLDATPRDVPALFRLLTRGESVALPHLSIVILGAPSRVHLLEEMTHMLRSATAPPSPVPKSPGALFIEATLQEALGFFASLIANPRRTVPSIGSLLLEARRLARSAMAALHRATFPDVPPNTTPADWNAAVHFVGYSLARRIDGPRLARRLLRAPIDKVPALLGSVVRSG